jgi:hypothetical protein
MSYGREQLEHEISHTAEQLNYFEDISPDILESPILIHFIYAARALYSHYQQTTDTSINQTVIGLVIDLSIQITLLPDNYHLNQYQGHRASQVASELEALINNITAAVESNIASGRS